MPLRRTPSTSSAQLQDAGGEHAPRLDDAGQRLVADSPSRMATAAWPPSCVRLSTIETDELSTNLPNELSTPDSSATSDMHSR